MIEFIRRYLQMIEFIRRYLQMIEFIRRYLQMIAYNFKTALHTKQVKSGTWSAF